MISVDFNHSVFDVFPSLRCLQRKGSEEQSRVRRRRYSIRDSKRTLGASTADVTCVHRFSLDDIDNGDTQVDTNPRDVHDDLFKQLSNKASKRYVQGYGSAFNVGYVMYDAFGPYIEYMAPTAFDKSLELPDLQASLMLGHDGLGLATTRAGRLVLGKDDYGLAFVASLNMDEPDAAGLYEKLNSGSTPTDTSVGGWIREAEWNEWVDVVEIQDWSLSRGEISIVQAGANPAGWAGVRKGSAKKAQQNAMIDFMEFREGLTL